MAESKKKTSFTTEIRNGEALGVLARKLQPVLVIPDPVPTASTEDFFKRLNMASKLEANLGSDFTIDIQPDLRFPLYYSIYNTIRTFPSLDVKCYPYVSPFTLTAYEQLILTGHLLLSDIHTRPICSHAANLYRRDNGTGDLLNALMEAVVPSHMEPLLSQLVSVHDPNHPDLLYVPNLGSFSWKHDYGRTPPISIMLAAHNAIASSRDNQPNPEAIIRAFYNTVICTVDQTDFTVSNFLGGWYRHENHDYHHDNWLNQAIEEIFNPIVGRSLTNRPTLKRLTLTPTIHAQNNQINPYSLIFAYNDTNLQTILNLINNLSDFTQKSNRGKRTLLQLSGEAAGITILSHSVEPPTLPTWHQLSNSAAPTDNRNDTQYAADINFLRPKVIGDGNLTVPTAEQCLEVLSLVRTANCTAANETFKTEIFDAHKHVTPPVLYFQPYDRSSSTLNYTVTLGIKIESAEFDGVAIPIPNQWDSLIDNNSRFRSGSIPCSQVYPSIPDAAIPIRINARVLHNERQDPLGLAIVDMTRNILPRFGNQHVLAPQAILPGFAPVQPVHRPDDAFTYTATSGNTDYPTGTRNFYLWSSYRYSERLNAQTPQIHFYFTLRGMYGTAVLLQRSENPARLLPR